MAMIRQPVKQRSIIAAALLLIASPALADDSAFIGHWTGTVSELGLDVPYTITLDIFEKDGRLYQNTRYGDPLDCTGGGVVMERGTGMIRFVEFITRNRELCSDGSFRLYPNGDGQLIWEWFYPDGAYAARADLTAAQ